MLTTYLDVLKEVVRRYEHATALSRQPDDPNNCVYSHDRFPGAVGCAIGCLFTPEQANQLDHVTDESSAINRLYKRREGRIIINQVLDVWGIGMPKLVSLQNKHDTAYDVDHFRRLIHNEIALLTQLEDRNE